MSLNTSTNEIIDNDDKILLLRENQIMEIQVENPLNFFFINFIQAQNYIEG